MQKILVENVPYQSFTANIEAERRTLRFEIAYNTRANSFSMGIFENGIALFDKLALVSGTLLCKQFNFFTGDFVVVTTADFLEDPKMGSWQMQADLYYLTAAEIEALRN